MSHRSIVCLLLLIFPLAASAGGGLAPKKASDIVKVNQSGQACPISGYALDSQELPTGGSTTFAIPNGKVLIVTGVTWSATLGAPGAPVIGVLSSQVQGVSFVSNYYSTTAFASDGTVLKSELTPQIVVAPGRSLCFYVTAGSFNAAVIYGFLAPDK